MISASKIPLFKLLIVLVGLSLMGCQGTPWNRKASIPAEYKEYFELPLEKQLEAFIGFPLDKQFEIALIEARMEPPHSGFLRGIASRREEAVPFLLEKLKGTDEFIHEQIITILQFMSEEHVDLVSRQDVIDAISEAISQMKVRPRKERCQEMLNSIERNKVS